MHFAEGSERIPSLLVAGTHPEWTVPWREAIGGISQGLWCPLTGVLEEKKTNQLFFPCEAGTL